MKHAPATWKGRLRKWAAEGLELAIGMCIVLGALFVFCLMAGAMLGAVGVG